MKPTKKQIKAQIEALNEELEQLKPFFKDYINRMFKLIKLQKELKKWK